jgi:SAM-dependent methyltransferase
VRVLASKGKNRPDLWPRLSASQFDEIVRTFANDGLLVAVHRAADVGYFRKSVPLCPYFGFSRGTPIDRYYLSQFVKEIRQEVRGSTLEIGGDTNSRVAYGFSEAAAYRTLDIDEDARADIVADVHSPTACAEESFDSIVLFNVLEHCRRPWVAVDNIHKWLRVGGKVFCMVPAVQRMHRLPKDYWRFMPDALETLFEKFGNLNLGTYGNLLASAACLAGLSAEELTVADLNHRDSRYPVAICLVAEKVSV